MNRARNFPPSPGFIDMADTLALQIADLECAPADEVVTNALVDIFSATEKALIRKPIENVGDLLLKIELLVRIAEHSEIDGEEWQALARDVESLNGPGMTFKAEAWLRRWTAKGGGYVCTDSGVSFVTPQPATFQQRLLLKDLQQAGGHSAVANAIGAAGRRRDGRAPPR